MSKVKSDISKNEAVQQREILKELYQKELINKYSKTNGFDKPYLVEQVNIFFSKYKVNKENMERLEKKMLKQFDQNYMKHFQMKQVNMIKEKSEKKQKLKSSKNTIQGTKQNEKSEKQEGSKQQSQQIQNGEEKKSAIKSIAPKTETQSLGSLSLADSKPCDLKKLWERENAKLKEKKLKEQEEWRKELDALQNTRKQQEEQEKKEDIKYMQQNRKENRRLDRLDREKAKENKLLMEKEVERIAQQREEKKKLFQEEKDYDMKKHNEMMGIVNKQQKEEEKKEELRAREARKLLRNQLRDVKKFYKREEQERQNEKLEEQERMKLYAELEEKRFQQREKEVKDREERVKRTMNAYHEKVGKDLQEFAKEDEEKMFKEMLYQDKKDNEVEEYRKGLLKENKQMLKRTLLLQITEKKQREQQEKLREIKKDNYFNDINQNEILKSKENEIKFKENQKVYNQLLQSQMKSKINPLKKMNSQELLLNKDRLKQIQQVTSNPSSPAAHFPFVRKLVIKDF